MNIKKFINYVSRLATVKRFSQSTLCVPESVLEHSASATLFCLFIGESLIEEGYHIDIGKLLKKAIIHDFDEIQTGDVARPVKYFSKEMRKMFSELEQDSMRSITSDFCDDNQNLKVAFYDAWLYSKSGVEGRILAICDFVCVVYKIHNEIVMRGNRTMFYYFEESYIQYFHQLLIEFKNEYQELHEQIPNHMLDEFPGRIKNSEFLDQFEKQIFKLMSEIRMLM